MVGRTSLLSTGSMHLEVKTTRVLIELYQLSTAVLIYFSKFVEGLSIQGTLRYTGNFSGLNRLRVKN